MQDICYGQSNDTGERFLHNHSCDDQIAPNNFYIQIISKQFTALITIKAKHKKVKLFLCLIKHHAMKTYGRMEV
jgi:hypothetical protein